MTTMTTLYPDMRFSWEIKSVDAIFNNGVARFDSVSLCTTKRLLPVAVERLGNLYAIGWGEGP